VKRTGKNVTKKTTAAPAERKPRAPRAASRTAAPRLRDVNAASPATNGGPSHQAIAEAAYYLFLMRGGQPGFEFDDWITAERRLLERV
jgi:hypothetical protein